MVLTPEAYAMKVITQMKGTVRVLPEHRAIYALGLRGIRKHVLTLLFKG